MCKEFDKNSTYSPYDIALALYEKYPNHYASIDSAQNSIGNFLTRHGYRSLNEQKRNRIFSGIVCQDVFDYMDRKISKEESFRDKDAPTHFNVEKRRGVSIELHNDAGLELNRRSKSLNRTKADIVTEALTEFFEKHPFDPYEGRTREDLIEELKMLKGEV